MNERIQEMARQAGAQHRLNLGVEEFCFEHSELEKFAELIVEECATAIINDRRLSDVRSAANGCVRTIREHFGVEE